MPKRGHGRSRRADSRGHDERGTCTPRTIKPTSASRITLRGASHTHRLTHPPCSCPPQPSWTRAPAEMKRRHHAASPRSHPPSTSNHGPTAHESRRRGVAWLGQAVRWSGSGAGPTGCHQASGGGCSGLPQPTMNSACGCGRRCGGLRRSESAAEHFFIWVAYSTPTGVAAQGGRLWFWCVLAVAAGAARPRPPTMPLSAMTSPPPVDRA
eukprot:COSAG01_NODE_4234_length_5218_cov_69.637429_1_plen_210_part_00